MVYNFKGQVKKADVKKAFDDMVNKVNALRQKYDAAIDATNYGLDKGAPSLAPNRYTLSVGGLKRVISDSQGQVIGCRVFKYENDFFISDGVVFKDGGVVHVSQQKLTGGGTYVVLNASGLPIITSTPGSNFIITRINLQEGNGLCDIVDAILDVPKRVIFCGNNSVDRWTSQRRNSGVDQFVSMSLNNHTPGYPSVFFNGVMTTRIWRTTSHNGKTILFYDHFFLPKNAANPWTATQDRGVFKVFNPIVQD